MKWFEEHIEMSSLSDDQAWEGGGPAAITRVVDQVLTDELMPDFVRGHFINQRRFAEFLGVSESTVAGWMKSEAFPQYAKVAAIGAWLSRRTGTALQICRREAVRPKVVRDGGRYMIVRLERDLAGVELGDVVARDIATEQAALSFARSFHVWDLIDEAEEVIDHEIDNRDNNSWLIDLKERIALERARTFKHSELLQMKERQAKELSDLSLADFFGTEDGAPATAKGEGE